MNLFKIINYVFNYLYPSEKKLLSIDWFDLNFKPSSFQDSLIKAIFLGKITNMKELIVKSMKLKGIKNEG